MEEDHINNALESCRLLERSLADTIQMVRDLNVRYNVDSLAKNWRAYINCIISQYRLPAETATSSTTSLTTPSTTSSTETLTLPHSRSVGSVLVAPKRIQKIIVNHHLRTRSSHELFGLNKQLNFRFIKIKRSLETIMNTVKRTMKIAKRQPDYAQYDYNWRLRALQFDRV